MKMGEHFISWSQESTKLNAKNPPNFSNYLPVYLEVWEEAEGRRVDPAPGPRTCAAHTAPWS